MKRVQALKGLAFEKRNFDAFLVFNEYNMRYLTGTPGAACLLIPKNGDSILYSYGRDYDQTKAEARAFDVELVKRNEKISDKIGAQLKDLKMRKLATDGISYDMYRMLAKALRGKARLKVQASFMQQLRSVKDQEEQKLMRKAGDITVVGMKVANETIRPGVSEIAVGAEIEYAMRRKGGYGTAFETIVASGIRSAYPHGGCSLEEIRRGDLVVVDIGSKYGHYCSDMTRTFVAGKPTAKHRRLYDVVKAAQEKAFHVIKASAKGKGADQVARKVIEEAGYEENFNHSLGHGMGLEIHESPVLGPSSRDRLVAGNVVSNEPGIYFSGYGGFRIEDTLLVKKRVSEKLTDGFYSLDTAR